MNAFLVYTDFAGLYSARRQTVECLMSASTGPDISALSKAVRITSTTSADERLQIRLPRPLAANQSLAIGEPSRECNRKWEQVIAQFPLSLTIEGISVPTEKKAVDVLELVFNALYLQLESIGIRIQLGRRTRPSILPLLSPPPATKVRFPSWGYPLVPSALYQQGVQSGGMLRFLSFYQVAEFYFPNTFVDPATERVRELLEHKGYKRASAVAREVVLATVERQLRRVMPGENEMLLQVLQGSITGRSLTDFVEADASRSEFLPRDKSLGGTPLTRARTGEFTLTSVRDRLYTIRNRIVHSKGEGVAVEPIAPGSHEVKLLAADTDVMQFIARRILHKHRVPIGGNLRAG
jgi:hypothetical protein